MEKRYDRRRFLRNTAIALAATELAMTGLAHAQLTGAAQKKVIGETSQLRPFGLVKQIDAGVLSVGYVEDGPANGPVVILLHGWPYDIHSFADVTPLLAAAGYRVIVPYLRGFGTTRFLSEKTPRNGQQSVIAADIIALMDALYIEKAILAGFDWGAPDSRHHRGSFSTALQRDSGC